MKTVTHFASVAFSLCLAATLDAQPKAYLAHAAGNLMTVLDTKANTVLRTVPVDAGPAMVAISKDGARAYVVNTTAATVSVIDTVSDTVVTTIPVGANAAAIALAPNGTTAYVLTLGAVQVIALNTSAITATIPVPVPVTPIPGVTITFAGIAITPDGSRLYVTTGPVSVIDTASNAVVATFTPTVPTGVGVTEYSFSGNVAINRTGTRAYIAVTSYYFSNIAFSMGGGVAVVDTATNSVLQVIDLFASSPGQLALTPDGSRGYVAINSTWVSSYASGAFPGRSLEIFDTSNNTFIGQIDLGADGPSWAQQNTAAGVAVTPDRSEVYVAVPRINSVAVIPVNTNVISLLIPVSAGPGSLAITPDPNAILTPYIINAVDDIAAIPIPSTPGGVAVANVLVNDTLGAAQAILGNVTLSQVSSTSASVTLNVQDGSVNVAAGTSVGKHSVVYKICDKTMATNCDQATATLTVRAPYVIDAVKDMATSLTGRVAISNVLANDTLAGASATLANVNLTKVSSTNAGLSLNVTTGAVSLAVGTPTGVQTLVYRICEKASPTNCDTAPAVVTVIPFVIDAINDSGTITRVGGIALPNVLANDTFNGATATLSSVTLSQLSSSSPGVTLNVASGAVSVAPATLVGAYTLNYRICETASPVNCDSAVVSISVTMYVIDAINDVATASSKVASTPIANVLSNDTLGAATATLSNVTLSQVSLTPGNSQIRLNLLTGGVDVLGATTSGLYTLVYQICEVGNAGNCDLATVSLTLSGGSTTYKIKISKNGKGTVTTNPAGSSFASGTVVTLTANPDAGSVWNGWSGDCSGISKTCMLTMNSDKSVTANFR